jgi:hypothetical protein
MPAKTRRVYPIFRATLDGWHVQSLPALPSRRYTKQVGPIGNYEMCRRARGVSLGLENAPSALMSERYPDLPFAAGLRVTNRLNPVKATTPLNTGQRWRATRPSFARVMRACLRRWLAMEVGVGRRGASQEAAALRDPM